MSVAKPHSIGNQAYALTISSNYAVEKNSFKAYKYIIKQLPTGVFYYTHEHSRKGKYHIHGIMQFKYKFNYPNLMRAKQTEGDYSFDVHIRYDKIIDDNSLEKWYDYITKQSQKWHKYKCNYDEIKVRKIPESCIPQVKIVTYNKSVAIPGLSGPQSGITTNASQTV